MRLSLGITGHRDTNPTYTENAAAIAAALQSLFAHLGDRFGKRSVPRLHALLALGADLQAVETALAMGWQVAAPLPFGRRLNIAINAQPTRLADAEALLRAEGECSFSVAQSANRIANAAEQATCLELAERDAAIESLFLSSLHTPADSGAQAAFAVAASERAALAGKVMIGQIDMLIAVWDGQSPGPVGGTRHTMSRALDMGIPILWIDAGKPFDWRLLDNPDALANRWALPTVDPEEVEAVLHRSITADRLEDLGRALLDDQKPPVRSRKRFHIYRRVEVLFAGKAREAFGGLTQRYPTETDAVTGGTAALLESARRLSSTDPVLLGQMEKEVIRRFARADALSTYLSDAYRGGMVANLLLAACAVIGGVAYLPLVDAAQKWPFALFEFAILGLILSIIAIGRSRDWHGRWFQTRRVAEYLRHAPFMQLLGVARPASAWPQSADEGWPEAYVRAILRELGLPGIVVSHQTLRTALQSWIGTHVAAQRAYHVRKAERLERIHTNLEKMSERLFLLAIVTVAAYLLGEVAGWAQWIALDDVRHSSKAFTFLGVALPTLGGALAGIHYFADFGRFAAISESTANRLQAVEQRIAALLSAPDSELDYGRVANIASAVDEIVVAEIEHWQDVFGGKHISVPV